MRIFYSEDHRQRQHKTELYGGELVSPFEAPFRLEWILEAVRASGFNDIQSPKQHDLSIAKKVHDPDYLVFLQTVWDRWVADGYSGEAIPSCFPVRRMAQRVPDDVDGALGYYAFAAETSISKGTYEAARRAMDCSLDGALEIMNRDSGAFALSRPPGHHAAYDYFGGYCFINSAAVAAQVLRDEGVERVAVLDVDFHHGNGTQDIFYKRDDVFFLSLHGDPKQAFPHFLGFADEMGMDAGEGFNKNYPLPAGTDFEQWREALGDALRRVSGFGAQALVVSLGVDTFENDPISFFRLASDDYLTIGKDIAKLNLPTLFCMEGGYGVREIGTNVTNVLLGFEDA